MAALHRHHRVTATTDGFCVTGFNATCGVVLAAFAPVLTPLDLLMTALHRHRRITVTTNGFGVKNKHLK
jgi:hypothetical protein